MFRGRRRFQNSVTELERTGASRSVTVPATATQIANRLRISSTFWHGQLLPTNSLGIGFIQASLRDAMEVFRAGIQGLEAPGYRQLSLRDREVPWHKKPLESGWSLTTNSGTRSADILSAVPQACSLRGLGGQRSLSPETT
jgi:hypothetical protein